MIELLPILMFVVVCTTLMAGFPVAFTLAGVALIFASIGIFLDALDPNFLSLYSSRVFGVISNRTLIAVPLFVFMGVVLEKSRIAEELLENMDLFQ